MPLYQHFACMCHGRNGRGARAQPYQLDMDGLIRVEQQIICLWSLPYYHGETFFAAALGDQDNL